MSAPSVTPLAADVPPSRRPIAAPKPTATAPSNPNAPVPLVDDQGQPVLNKDGKIILRPASLDPHVFVRQGMADRKLIEELVRSGDEGVVNAVAYEIGVLSRFAWYMPWDAQRLDWKFLGEFRDYATVAIGLYAAAAGLSRDDILQIENLIAWAGSRFHQERKYDPFYHSLPETNVWNTDSGRDLFFSGRIRAGHVE